MSSNGFRSAGHTDWGVGRKVAAEGLGGRVASPDDDDAAAAAGVASENCDGEEEVCCCLILLCPIGPRDEADSCSVSRIDARSAISDSNFSWF